MIDWSKLILGYDRNRHYPDTGDLVEFSDEYAGVVTELCGSLHAKVLIVKGFNKGAVVECGPEQYPYVERKLFDKKVNLEKCKELAVEEVKLKYEIGDIAYQEGMLVAITTLTNKDYYALVLQQDVGVCSYDYTGQSILLFNKYRDYFSTETKD